MDKQFPDLNLFDIDSLITYRNKVSLEKPLISVHEDTPLFAVLLTLKQNAIQSVPVFYQSSDGGKSFTGIVSVFDILAWTVFERMFDELENEKNQQISFQKYCKILKEENNYFSTPIKKLVGKTHESSQNWLLSSSDPISRLLALFTNGRMHRILITDEKSKATFAAQGKSPISGEHVTIVSQTDLVRYLWEFLKVDIPIPACQINEISLNRYIQSPVSLIQKVDSVSSTVSALTAFRMMYIHRKNALAIVDNDNRLVANISASDLRGIDVGNIEKLMDNVCDFLEKEVSKSPAQLSFDQLRTAKLGTLVNEVVDIMLKSHVHRVWLTSDDDIVVGVISLSDILTIFANVPVLDVLEE